MRRKLLLNLILSLTFGTIILPSISGCANNETQEEKTIIELNYDKSLGSVTASKTECQPGETITLEIKPNAGYEISLVKINGIKAEISESISFTAQKGKNEIIVAFYKPYVDPTVDNSYQILTNYDTTKGEVRVSPVKVSNYLETFVNVSVKPYGGNEVSSILVNDVEFSKENLEFTFKPVKGDNLVKVEFEGGNIIEEFENFNIDLVYNEKYGTINLENTSVQDMQFVNTSVGFILEFKDVAMGIAFGDIKKTTDRKTVEETDNGIKIKERIAELQELLKAYRDGLLIEKL